eukprot:TRINITY_DN9774_c0_g1_i2.p1 TRINITY_DN9774_c0_g1~~TRINITY_DN9774_c0_g1_i2.p1  ORF type:complete len:196 (+),score=9.73 TRINITY_DN9774_c0_g1_i2:79-666(+)
MGQNGGPGYSLLDSYCDTEHIFGYVRSSLVFWAWVFALSKYLELFDTILLILKNPHRPIRFLHWYHHITVLLFTWYAGVLHFSAGMQFIIFNGIVHSFMYLYYFLTEIKIKIPGPLAMALTMLQISQMVYGIFVNATVAYRTYILGDACTCEAMPAILLAALGMYGSYLFLFVKFFVQRYMHPKPRGKIDTKKEK